MPVEERKAAIGALDEEIKVLTRRRAVLSGELYTLRGRFKAMGRDYGLPFMVWWTAVWLATGVGIYSAISVRTPCATRSCGERVAPRTRIPTAESPPVFLATQYGEVDVVQVIGQLDLMLGTQLASRLPDIDPTVRASLFLSLCTCLPACLPFCLRLCLSYLMTSGHVHERLTGADCWSGRHGRDDHSVQRDARTCSTTDRSRVDAHSG